MKAIQLISKMLNVKGHLLISWIGQNLGTLTKKLNVNLHKQQLRKIINPASHGY